MCFYSCVSWVSLLWKSNELQVEGSALPFTVMQKEGHAPETPHRGSKCSREHYLTCRLHTSQSAHHDPGMFLIRVESCAHLCLTLRSMWACDRLCLLHDCQLRDQIAVFLQWSTRAIQSYRGKVDTVGGKIKTVYLKILIKPVKKATDWKMNQKQEGSVNYGSECRLKVTSV